MITTISGSNTYAIAQDKKTRTGEFTKEYSDFALQQINCDEVEYQVIYDDLMNLPFLSSKKLLVLNQPSTNKQFTENFEVNLTKIPDSTDVLIIEGNIDKRSTFFKQLKKFTNFINYDYVAGSELTKWIVSSVENRGGKISAATANYLVELTGTNQLRISNELDKLITYNFEITRENINLLVEPLPQSTIFQLLDAVFSRNTKELLKIYDDQRQQKVQPQQIIALLTWQVHILALVKSAGANATSAEIASKAKLNPFVVSKSLAVARNLSFADIKNLSEKLLELDIKLKSQTLDADEALLQLLLTIAN